jgi:hypothetical protein
MTYPKLKACKNCGSTDMLEIYTYESGWRRVECDKCMHFGPGEGNILSAIRGWNKQHHI